MGTPAWSPTSLQNLGGRARVDVSCPRAKLTFNRLLFSQPQCMLTALSPVDGKWDLENSLKFPGCFFLFGGVVVVFGVVCLFGGFFVCLVWF